MSEPAQRFDANSDPMLSKVAMSQGVNENPSFRNAMPSTSIGLTGGGLPALPPRPDLGMQSYGYNQNSGYGMTGMNPGMSGGYGMGGIGGGFGMGGYGGYGSYGMGGMGSFGSPYGGYNRFGPMYGGDLESRFIQMAEENSRPAFDSIQSVVHAVGSVAMMLENTFFALTSSFRAILGVAENFGRLRSLFAQFWSTFAVVRSLNWLVRKLMVMLGIRTESEFKAWAQAVAATQSGTATPEQQAKGSSWPILLFFGVIATAPYIVLRMLNSLTSSIHESLNDPTSWQNPLRAIGQYDFAATSPQEISFSANQVLTLAPQHLQGNLWNSGWLMASTDKQTAGLVPVNYIKVVKPTNQTEANKDMVKPSTVTNLNTTKEEPSLEELNTFYEKEL